MYFTYASFFVLSQIVIWFYYQNKSLGFPKLMVRPLFVNSKSSVLDCISFKGDKPLKNNSVEKSEQKFFDSNEIQLNFNLKTLEFINILEHNLGAKISSNAFTSDDLEDLLRLKKNVQQKILESTKNYLDK